jgi:hypothetical protein
MRYLSILVLSLFSCLLASAGEKKPAKDQTPPAIAPAFALLDVTVSSIPNGARIEVGGIPVGRTAATTKLQPGEYRVRLTLEGYETWERKIAVRLGETNAITVELQRKNVPATSPHPTASKPREATSPLASVPVVRSDGGVATNQSPVSSDSDVSPPVAASTKSVEKDLHVGPRGGI